MRTSYLLPASLALLLAACDPSVPPTAAAQPSAPAAAAVPPEAVAAAPAAPLPLNAAPVDVCALLGAEVAASVLGPLSGAPTAKPAQGSLLGECDYSGTNGLAMVSARPAAEYDDTVRYASRRGGTRSLSGLAGPATLTPSGLMLQPQGQRYFVVINAVAFHGSGEGLAEGIAHKLTFGDTP
ncbi:MAG: hypothetical protein WC809_12350 [Sinimarinibacterium sp.]|jgi:hypothetical protein